MMMSACGVMCSDCPAFQAASKGVRHQERTAQAWRRIYDLNFSTEQISCGGCLGPDEELFQTMRSCAARICCKSRGFSSCAECPVDGCELLAKAQSVWDTVPELVNTLSVEDFEIYAQPYCGHRGRLAGVRDAFRAGGRETRT